MLTAKLKFACCMEVSPVDLYLLVTPGLQCISRSEGARFISTRDCAHGRGPCSKTKSIPQHVLCVDEFGVIIEEIHGW
jgi:hypothetical protein